MAEDDPAQAEHRASARLLPETAAQLPETLSRLERVAKSLPTDEDFHFYYNFREFREPVQALQARVENLLSQFSSLSVLPRAPAWPSDPDNLNDWLVGMQDELLEQVDSAFDRFKKERAEQGLSADDDGFMYQNVKKKRRRDVKEVQPSLRDDVKAGNSAEKDGKKTERCPIPFHVWSIPRPQEKFDVTVDNSNTPFKHPKPLSGPTEGNEPAHPLQEELQNMNFEDLVGVGVADPKQPASLSETPFTFVNTSSSLKDIAAKLSLEREIAVDLEHHQFRSFQGLTCLMQISTRSEDFIIDTLELRSLIGPQLRDVFANPAIQKVMHGANWDIMWLQRDFGIYVCNLFDTGQAARVLGMKSFGLAHLLEHFCGVTPDKRYQMADWRLRPLPVEMLKYAREDTHYLLYVGDLIKQMLISAQCGDQQEPLLEVYKRSRDICLKLYAKEITTETSYLQVYGLQERNFQTEQLAVLAGLYSWRDLVARIEDESTGYVLPNHLLLKLAEEMPDDVKKLRSMLNGRHSLVARNIATIVAIINKSRSMMPRFKNEMGSRLQAENSKSLMSFEETPFSESTPERTQGEAQDGPIFQKDDEASTMNGISDVTRESESVQNVPPSQYSENMEGVSGTNLACKSEQGGINGATVVLKRETKSSLFGKQKEKEKPTRKVKSYAEADFDFSSRDMSTERNELLEVEKMKGGVVAVPSAVVMKRATASSLFGKEKKISKVVDKVQNFPLAAVVEPLEVGSTGKQEATPHRRQIEDLAYMLGRRTPLQMEAQGNTHSVEDPEQVEAKSRAEKIRASFSLPFHTFDGVDYSCKPVIQHGKDELEQEHKQTRNFVHSQEQQTEDLIFLETDTSENFHECTGGQASDLVRKGIGTSASGTPHRLWWPDTLGSAQESASDTMFEEPPGTCDAGKLESELPLSISQKYWPSHHRREGMQSEPQGSQLGTRKANHLEHELRHQSRLFSHKKHMSQSHDEGSISVTPFDYAAAKKKMGSFRGFKEATEGIEGPNTPKSKLSKQGSRGNHIGGNETIFDPSGRIKEFKPEGISPGKRRQVFPQTGNRTGVFK